MDFKFNTTRKLTLLFFISVMYFPQFLFAQSYATVGAGTISYSSFPIPFANSYWGCRNQFYVKASELTTSGLSNGSVISSVGFNVDLLNASAPLQGWNVKVYSTSTTNPISTDWQTSGLISYSVPTTLTLTTGWNLTSLAYPFIWNGTDNLVIETCFNNSSTSANASVFRTAVSGATYSRFTRGNNVGMCSNNAISGGNAGSSTSIRPNIRFGYSSSSCSGLPTAGTASVSDPNPCAGVYISLGLTGTSTGNGTSVQWQQSSTGTGSWTNVTGATSYYYYFSATGSYYYRASVSCGVNQVYSNTVQVTVPAFLPAGTYTINSGQATNIGSGGSNFNNFADFSSAIAAAISGPIVANVTAAGTYTQPLIFTIGSTCGTSATNTITVNGNGATLNYVSSNSNQRGAVTINGSNYITINNLNINGYSTSSSNYCYGFLAANNAGNITINNCSVILDSNSTSTNYAGIVFSGSLTNPFASGSGGNNITLSNNTVNGGAYGIVMMSDTTTAHSGWIVTGNTLKNTGTYGIYGNAMNTPLIKSNDISRSGRTTMTDFNAIVVDNNCLYLKIQGNKIHDVGTGNPSSIFDFYGINILNSPANSSYKHDVSNNLMYNLTGSGNHYYFYNLNSANTNIFYNTVASMSTSSLASGVTVGYYHDISSNGFYSYYNNNNIVITRKSSNLKELYYINNGLARLTADNNNLYINGQGFNYAANVQGALYNTIYDWMNVLTTGAIPDNNSISLDPYFVNPSIGNLQPTNYNLDNLGVPKPNVLIDITGATRDATTPDVGAYEFTAGNCSGSPTAGIAASDVSQACSGGPVYLTLVNAVLNSGLSISWESKPTTGSSWTPIANSAPINYSSYYKATMPSVSTDFRAKLSCGANISYSTLVTVSAAPFYRCYCSPNTGVNLHNSNSNIITNVSVVNASLNSVSVDGSGTNGYSFNDPIFSYNTTTMTRGFTYTVNVSLSVSTDNVGMWVDYNQNGLMEASEYTLMTSSGGLATTTITIPNTAVGGFTGMRFRAFYNTITGSQACTNVNNIQETEDYVVNIFVPQPCSGTPTSGTAFGPSSICPNVSFSLNDTAYSLATGINFQWQKYNTTTSNWDNITGATNDIYVVTNGIATATNFRLSVKCMNTNITSYSNTVSITINAANGCYCTTNLYDPSGGCATDDYIRSFSTWGSTSNITNLNSWCNNMTTGYTYFSGMTHIAKQADTVFWALANTAITGNYEAYKIWVDFNHNGSFSDPGEYVYGSSTVLDPGDVDSGYFAIPYNASVGSTRIRIRCVYGGTNFTPCSNAFYGETEDYNLQINQNTNICQGAPTVTVTSPYNYFCTDTTVRLSGSTGNSLYYYYQWQTSPTGANTWTAIQDATDATYDVGGFLTATDFRMSATCPYGGAVGYSNVKTIAPSIATDDFIVPDTVNAYGTSYILNVVGSGYSSYLWNTTATTQTITITTDGMYICTVTQGLCTATDSVYVKFSTANPCTANITPSGSTTFCQGGSVAFNANTGSGLNYQWQNNGMNISGATNSSFLATTSGNYTVTISIPGICSNTSNAIIVTVNSLPTVSGGTNQTICAGQSVILTGSGTATYYAWNNGVNNGISFYPTTTTTYTVTGTGSNGCTNTAQTTVIVNTLPTVYAGSNQTICEGQSVTLTGSGTATSYSWNNGVSNGISFNPTATTTYTVTGTGSNGCTNTAQTTVTVNPLPTVSGGTNQTICAGQSVTLNGSGIATSYSWNNGVSNGVSFTPTATTTYTVTGTSSNGCNNTAQTTVTINPLPTVSGGTNQTICAGQSVTLTGSGTATSYTWNNGISNGISFIPTATTTYTVTGAGSNGCNNTAQATVTINPLPTVSGGTNQTICAGQSVTLSGSGTATSYAWNNGMSNGIPFIPTATTTYTVTGTGANGCTNTANVTVTVNALPIATINPSGSTTFCSGGNVVLNVNAGTGFTYQWKNNSTNISGATNSSYSASASGSYTVVVTNSSNCATTSTAITVTINALPTATITPVGSTYFCSGGNVVLNANTGTGLNYQWKNNSTNISGATTSSYTASTSGSYTVVVTNGSNCSTTSTATTVTVNPLPAATITPSGPTTFCAGNNVFLFGNTGAGLSYQWLNNGTNIIGATNSSYSVTTSGSYTLLVINSSNCLATSTAATVAVNTLPIVSGGSNQTVCAGQSVTLAGSGTATSYAWDNGVSNGVTFVPTQTTTYTVTGTDVNGCNNSEQTTVTINALPTVIANTNQTICLGQSVTLNGTGANTYTWNNGVTNNQSFIPTQTTTYTVTGTGANGCTNTAQTTVTVNSLPNVSAGVNQTICLGQSVALNGTGANTYTWNNGVTNNTSFIPTQTTTYTVTGTGANGCTNTAQTTVTVSPLPNVGADANQTICLGQSVTLNGTGANTYTWNNGVTNNTSFIPTQTTTYTVIGTGANGCTNTAQTTVTVSNSLTVDAGNDIIVCMGESIILHAIANASVSWSDGVVDNVSFIPTASTAYVATVSAGIGCSNSDTILVTVLSLPQVNAGSDVNVCEGDSIVLNATGALSYQWSGDVTNGVAFLPLINNIFAVLGTDMNGCKNSDTVQVSVLSRPIAFAGNNKTICPTATATLTSSSGASYLWSNGSTNQSINVGAGTYFVKVTASNGCSSISPSVNVATKSLPAAIKIKYIGNSIVCEPNGVQFAIDLLAGATTGFGYQWNLSGNPITGATDSTYYSTMSGAFTLTVSGGNNCMKTSVVKSATIKPLPAASFTPSGPLTFCTGGIVVLSAPTLNGYTYTWLKDGVSAGSGVSKSFKIAGNYTVVAKLNGCIDTANTSVDIVVNSLPIASIASLNPITFCAGDSAILAATPSYSGFNYQWLNGTSVFAITNSPNQTVNSIGTYKVMVTDTNSCTSKTSATNVKIKVNPLPVTLITPASSTTIAANGSVKLNASPSSGVIWQWYLNGVAIQGASTKQYTASLGGDYTVAIAKSGCVGISSPITVIKTGIREVQGETNGESAFEIVAYPNPVVEKLNFQVRGIEKINAIVQIIDFQGNLITTQEIKNPTTIIDMNHYVSGSYLIRYKDQEGREGTLKITKE